MIASTLDLQTWFVTLVYAIAVGLGFSLGWLVTNALFGAVRNR